MKAPAVALAAAFTGGILLGLRGMAAVAWSSRTVAAVALVGIAALLLCGLLLNRRGHLRCAAFTSLSCWAAMGALAGYLTQLPLPAEHILRLTAANQIDLSGPLRWHGRLRSDPARLPWGSSMEMDLRGVESAQGWAPVTGGMRVGYTPKEGDDALPELRAGDEVSVLAQARLPFDYKDPGAFRRRDFLKQQNIHVLATLRSSALMERTWRPRASFETRIAGWRTRLRSEVDDLYSSSPVAAGTLRAMLLGDRSFVDRAESVDFQKTGVFHVLVVAGLHVGALAFFLYLLGRWLRLSSSAATVLLLAGLCLYVAIVEQRAPVWRAGLMVTITALGGYLYRRMDLLNSAAMAALILLVAKPLLVLDTSFQLSFLAIGSIAGVAAPWIERHIRPWVRTLRGWRDVTRDGGYAPALAQFRLDLRDAMRVLTARLGVRSARRTQDGAIQVLGWAFRGSELLAVSIVLQLGMLPLMALDFHRVTLIGPLANLAAVPLTGLIVPAGFLSLGTALVLPGAAHVLARPLGWLLEALGHAVSWFARVPGGSYRIPGPPTWLVVAFFAALAATMVVLRFETVASRRMRRATAAVLAVAAILIATYPFRPATSPSQLEVTVLDVAQGDSILVVSPKGSTLLIDGGGAFQGFRGREEHLGPDPGEDAVSPYLWSRGFRELDAVALTHAHQDHVGGLSAILENFRVGRLWIGRETAASALARLKDAAQRAHVPVEHQRRGNGFLWDGVQVDFLWPEAAPEEVALSAKNNDSLVIRLRYGGRTILLPGDAEKQVEYSLLAESGAAELRADVLKVGHHGSKNSTMPEFLAAAAPQVAIISAGEENPYGHPSAELLQRLEGSGSRVLRTDRQGAVQVLTDGTRLSVRCYVACDEGPAESSNVQTPDHDQRK